MDGRIDVSQARSSSASCALDLLIDAYSSYDDTNGAGGAGMMALLRSLPFCRALLEEGGISGALGTGISSMASGALGTGISSTTSGALGAK